jgi:hypothetical protein
VNDLGPLTRTRCADCSHKIQLEEEEKEHQRLRLEEIQRQQERISMAHIPPRWKEVTFDNSDHKINPKVLSFCRQYAEAFAPKSSPSLYMYSQ